MHLACVPSRARKTDTTTPYDRETAAQSYLTYERYHSGINITAVFYYLNPGQLRSLLQLKPVGTLTINLKIGVFWDVTQCGSCKN
jgi:hypothetical protein